MANHIEVSPSPSEHVRRDIQGLRAIAVILVILSHAGFQSFTAGFIGVDVFFVISGYVITQVLQRRPPRQVLANLRHFYIRRVLRIVPAATLTLTATVAVAYFLLSENFNASLIEDVRAAALFSANFRLISTSSDYFMSGIDPSLITHFWSLAVEEQFYFIYPLAVFSLTWIAPLRHRTAVLRLFLIVIIALSAVWSAQLTPLNAVEAYYSPFTRLWELALGGLVAVLPETWHSVYPRIAQTQAWMGAGLLTAALIVISPTSGFPGTAAWLPCLSAALLLHAGESHSTTGLNGLLGRAPLKYIGDISYSLYLWHYVWLILPAQLPTPLNGPATTLIGFVGTFACAAVSYHAMENRIRHSNRLQRDGLATGLLLLICIAITLDATVVIESLYLNR